MCEMTVRAGMSQMQEKNEAQLSKEKGLQVIPVREYSKS